MEVRLKLLQVRGIIVPFEAQRPGNSLWRRILLTTQQLVHMQEHIPQHALVP